MPSSEVILSGAERDALLSILDVLRKFHRSLATVQRCSHEHILVLGLEDALFGHRLSSFVFHPYAFRSDHVHGHGHH